MEEDDVLELIDFDGDDVYVESSVTTPTKDNENELRVGMEFSTIQEVHDCYALYGKSKGFQIRKRNSRERMIQFVCYREGFHKLHKQDESGVEMSNPQSNRYTKTCRIGCRASLNCTLDYRRNVWKVTKFDDQHNHDMVSPKSRKYLRTHKKVSSSAKCLSQVFASEGIPVGKVRNVLHPNVEDAEFTRKDCYNYMTCLRKRILDCGDAQAVYQYCTHQQELNPNFWFNIQLDSEDRMMNFFWVDARSRAAYRIFGDIVSFDTTYKTNKYSMPFAPFVGLDNHRHTILFGCALLQDETEATFTWLFKAWLHAMEGNAPSSIITDQDMAIMNAVAHVFPTTKHRLCLWHITKKFPERLAHIYHEKSSFKPSLNKCIHDSVSIEEFEDSWKRLVIEFGLEQNDWLRNLYSMRQLWVPVFCKDVFFGGMNTTGRSESINAFFDAFVHSGTTLKEFVEKYGQALENRYETFRRAEFDTRHKVPILSLGMGLEEHASSIYTHEIFKEFHIQLTRSLSYNREILLDDNHVKLYRVKNRLSKGMGVIVNLNMDTFDCKCECKMFEFEGIICRHILSVFFMHSIDEIPQQFILKRWMKDVGQILWDAPIGREMPVTPSIAHFNLKITLDDLYSMSQKSEVILEYIRKGVEVLHTGAKTWLDKNIETGNHCSQSSQFGGSQFSDQHSTPNIQDPFTTQTKGRKKSSRMKSSIETSMEPSIRCSVCFTNGHNRRTCPKTRQC